MLPAASASPFPPPPTPTPPSSPPPTPPCSSAAASDAAVAADFFPRPFACVAALPPRALPAPFLPRPLPAGAGGSSPWPVLHSTREEKALHVWNHYDAHAAVDVTFNTKRPVEFVSKDMHGDPQALQPGNIAIIDGLMKSTYETICFGDDDPGVLLPPAKWTGVDQMSERECVPLERWNTPGHPWDRTPPKLGQTRMHET
eukprot:1158574-Pelagomonas_calceolata.AAC.7